MERIYMRKKTQESEQPIIDGDFFYQWIPYVAAGMVFVLALTEGMIRTKIWLVLVSGVLATLVFLIVRMVCPLPTVEEK